MASPTKSISPRLWIGSGGQRLLEEGHDFVVAPAQDHGVIHVRGHTLQAVHQDLDHGTDIFVDMLGVDAVGLALADHAGQIIGRFPVGHRAGDGDAGSSLGLLFQLKAVLDDPADAGRLEVHVGDGGEEPLDGEAVDLGVAPQLVGIERQALQAVEQVILQCRHIRFLAAYARNVTPDSVCCLLALITKHTHFCFLPFVGVLE